MLVSRNTYLNLEKLSSGTKQICNKRYLVNSWPFRAPTICLTNHYVIITAIWYEKLDGPAVSALGVWSRKLSNFLMVSHRIGEQNLLSRALCFGRHVKPLVPVGFAKNNCTIFTRIWGKYVVPTTIKGGIRIGKRRAGIWIPKIINTDIPYALVQTLIQ
jgi:hypothetical protein